MAETIQLNTAHLLHRNVSCRDKMPHAFEWSTQEYSVRDVIYSLADRLPLIVQVTDGYCSNDYYHDFGAEQVTKQEFTNNDNSNNNMMTNEPKSLKIKLKSAPKQTGHSISEPINNNPLHRRTLRQRNKVDQEGHKCTF